MVGTGETGGGVRLRLPLRSARLILRPLAATDAPTLYRFAADWELARGTANIPHPYDLRMAREFIAWSEGEFAAGRSYGFAVIERATGLLVGVITLSGRGPGSMELGYWIGRPHQGRGYASEAAQRLVEAAFDELGIGRVTAACLPDNEPSWRVMESCGMRLVQRVRRYAPARGRSFDLLLYAVDAVPSQQAETG
ncbi:MAG TPA: GNAT family N-acetyltransferase [Alphaproteobacteria bacterium]|nr:GNAT family N-acetyltransferase [Alphaproteobacteria bacterium]